MAIADQAAATRWHRTRPSRQRRASSPLGHRCAAAGPRCGRGLRALRQPLQTILAALALDDGLRFADAVAQGDHARHPRACSLSTLSIRACTRRWNSGCADAGELLTRDWAAGDASGVQRRFDQLDGALLEQRSASTLRNSASGSGSGQERRAISSKGIGQPRARASPRQDDSPSHRAAHQLSTAQMARNWP